MLCLCPGCGQWHPRADKYGYGVTMCRQCWLGDSQERFDWARRQEIAYVGTMDELTGRVRVRTPK
jgi:hypothetical protein